MLGRALAVLLLLAAPTALGTIGWVSPAVADGETLAQIKTRGTVRCGVSEGIAGFSTKDASGRWTGLDADFCRAVAAAALGDGEKVTFLPLRASARFPALQLGTIDLLARNTTWTLAREAGLKMVFVGILFHDGQAFMVPASSPVKSADHLNRATVCVEKGTTHESNMVEYFATRDMKITPVIVDSAVEVVDAFFAGRCGAYTSDTSQLVAARLRAPARQAFRILPDRISKEPVGPVVRRGDDDWQTLVRWVLFALIAAEEHGITRESAGGPGARRVLAVDAELGRALGADPDWARRAVQSVGNYGEMFDRNLGARSALKLERGLNRLWTQGGLMYAPPVR